MNTKNPILSFSGEYSWLSNFAPCEVYYDSVQYSSVENAYVAAKTLNLEDRKLVQPCPPGYAKRLGKKFQLRKDWNLLKVAIMRNLLIQKFSQAPYKNLLLATASQLLVETNTWGDRFWGVCNKTGENMLGILIMDIRDDLKILEENV